jgi:hypothetical protein
MLYEHNCLECSAWWLDFHQHMKCVICGGQCVADKKEEAEG